MDLKNGISWRKRSSWTFTVCWLLSSMIQLTLYLLSLRTLGMWTELAIRPAPMTPTLRRCFLLLFSTTVDSENFWHFCWGKVNISEIRTGVCIEDIARQHKSHITNMSYLWISMIKYSQTELSQTQWCWEHYLQGFEMLKQKYTTKM